MELWANTLLRLESQINSVSFDTWVKSLEPLCVIDNKLVLVASSKQVRAVIINNFKRIIEESINEASKEAILKKWSSREGLAKAPKKSKAGSKKTSDGSRGVIAKGLAPELIREATDLGQHTSFVIEVITEEQRQDYVDLLVGESGGGDAQNQSEIAMSNGRRVKAVQTNPLNTPQPTINMFNQRYTFASFVVGKSNEFAQAASRAVAEEPGKKFNPLFICGNVGLGKTHLMNAIGNEIKATKPNLNVLYVTCERFLEDFISYIRTQKKDASPFKKKYRNVDVLMIDDIQFIADKTGLQEEFFNVFNELHQSSRQIIISSDRRPKDIHPLEERIRTRLEWGLIVDIQPPDLETRIAILQTKSHEASANVPKDVLEFIAQKTSTNIRDMEGMLSRVIAFSSLVGRGAHPTLEIAKEALADYSDNTPKDSLTADEIITKVSKYFRISKDDIVGKKRTKEIVEARFIAIYLISELLAIPLASIGAIIGGRDHTSIMHARNQVEEHKDNKFRVALRDLMEIINN